jgi:hypothetical protein
VVVSTDTAPGSAVVSLPVHRIGVIIAKDKELKKPALEYLILHLNNLQRHFEYELLPNDLPNSPLADLDRASKGIPRKQLRDVRIPQFLVEFEAHLRSQNNSFGLREEPPRSFIFISLATFDDGYYSTRPSYELTKPNRMSVLALGDWSTHMAPPSILEFILTLMLREAVAFMSPSLQGSIHLGTKGCICDFTPEIQDAKYKALHGFVCDYCRQALVNDGLPNLAETIIRILKKEWLGKRSDPNSAAGILAHFQHDLSVTKGLTPGVGEKIASVLREEGTKQVLDIIGKIILALLFVLLAAYGIHVKCE